MQIRFPNSFTRTRTVFNPRVSDGWFRYQFGSEAGEVNLLQLAAANGQIATKDPISSNLMGLIDAATRRRARAAPMPIRSTTLLCGRARRRCSSISRQYASTTT
jgi:hypothetical protein